MADLDEVYAQLDEDIENARLDVEQAEADLKTKQVLFDFDRLMRLKVRIKNRVEKVRRENNNVDNLLMSKKVS